MVSLSCDSFRQSTSLSFAADVSINSIDSMQLSPAHLGLHPAVRQRGFPPSKPCSLDPLHAVAVCLIHHQYSTVPRPIPVRLIALYAVNTVQASPDRGHNLRYDHGPVLAARTHPYLARSSVIFLRHVHRRFIKSSCSCGAQPQMNLTSLAFLPTTHACAVDGNHHCAVLLCPACAFSVVGRRE